MGYTIDQSFVEAFNKQRVGIFPHTTKMEAFILTLTMLATNTRNKSCFPVAYEYMETPLLGTGLKYFGGFPVYKGSGMTKLTIEFLKENPNKCLAISPEGSLKQKEWQTGFFYIARELQIPIIVFGIDFEKHIIKACLNESILIGPEEKPGDRMTDIKNMFSRCGIIPLFPENSFPKINGSERKITSYLPLRGKIIISSLLIVITGSIIYLSI